MEHDVKCELIQFSEALKNQMGIELSPVHWRLVHRATRPVMCFCKYRNRPQAEPSPQEFDAMWRNLCRFVMDNRLGNRPGLRVNFSPEVRKAFRMDEDDRVIRVDFRTRRRLD